MPSASAEEGVSPPQTAAHLVGGTQAQERDADVAKPTVGSLQACLHVSSKLSSHMQHLSALLNFYVVSYHCPHLTLEETESQSSDVQA